MSERILKERIIERSLADNWEDAVKEWSVHKMYIGHGACTCGKKNIKRICVIKNPKTKLAVAVGSSCVHKFMNIPTQTMFTDITKLHKNKLHIVKECTAKLAFETKRITEWEYNFYVSIYQFSKLSAKQEAIVLKINAKLTTLINIPENTNGTI